MRFILLLLGLAHLLLSGCLTRTHPNFTEFPIQEITGWGIAIPVRMHWEASFLDSNSTLVYSNPDVPQEQLWVEKFEASASYDLQKNLLLSSLPEETIVTDSQTVVSKSEKRFMLRTNSVDYLLAEVTPSLYLMTYQSGPYEDGYFDILVNKMKAVP